MAKKKPPVVRNDPHVVVQRWLDMMTRARNGEAETVLHDLESRRSLCDALSEVIERANNGDQAALPAIRRFCEEDPEFAVTAIGGNLAERVERALVETFSKQLAFQEGVLAKARLLRAELAGPNPSPIERLLVERVAVCWLELHLADFLSAQVKVGEVATGEYYQRWQDRTHRRYLSAIKALATVRRLALPIRVDVSVAGEIETKDAEPAASRRWLPALQHN
jgi:hypothetical protein